MLTLTVNHAKVRELQESLGIKGEIRITIIDSDHPDVKATLQKGQHLFGDANRLNHVRLVVGWDDQATEKLMFAHAKIVRTLLHEIKHLEQFQKWSRADWERDKLYDYGVSPAEQECNDFAAANYQKWRGIITLKRPMKSRLSRLSSAEQNVRKSR